MLPPTKGHLREVLQDFHLCELQFDRGLLAEHMHNQLHSALVGLDFLDRTNKAFERAVRNLQAVPTSKLISTTFLSMPRLSISFSVSGTGFEPGPTKPVTPRMFRTIYHVSSRMTIFTST